MKMENMTTFRSQVEGGFPFVVNTTSNLRPHIRDKFQRAVNIASEKLKEENLKPFIDNYSYTIDLFRGRWWWRRKVGEKKYEGFHVDISNDIFNTTPDKILEIIQNGNELVLGEGSDGEADIFWKLNSRTKRGVVGYTYTNTIWQWTYRNWVEGMSDRQLAGHLVHEWLHKLGGAHAFKYHVHRQHTVTYAVGYFVGGRI
jgi:hypothetical protein